MPEQFSEADEADGSPVFIQLEQLQDRDGMWLYRISHMLQKGLCHLDSDVPLSASASCPYAASIDGTTIWSL